MKDPTYAATWDDSLALRIHYQQDRTTYQSSNSASEAPFEVSTEAAEPSDMQLCKMTRSTKDSLAALSSLPPAAVIALFTPVLIPANKSKTRLETDGTDPFESLGRSCTQHHKRVRHIPYVPKIGFRETHEAFISQVDVVIVVVCEPTSANSNSFAHQMAFAKQAVDAMEEKEANASNTLVLVQSGSEEFRAQAEASFVNVIEVSEYNADVAKEVARTIFKSRR